MSENTATPRSFHLYNCDNTYDLDSVEKLIKAVAGEVQVHQTYFPLPRMTQLSQELEGKTMDCAVFVVHAYESILSINQDRTDGIGYTKVYRALLRATVNKGPSLQVFAWTSRKLRPIHDYMNLLSCSLEEEGRVLIVIGGDDNYKTQEERDTSVLSQWARGKVSSQFKEEYMNGSRSFIFSWDKHHHPIHEDALQHFLDPKIFVPKPRPTPLPFNKGPSLQLFTWTSRKETLDIVHNFMSSAYNNLSLPGPPDAPPVPFDGFLSHLIKAKLDYAVAAVEMVQIERVVKDSNLRNLWRTRLESLARYIGKKAIILVCDDEANTGQMTSEGVLDVIQHIMSPNEANDKLLVMSWFMKPGVIHMDALMDILRYHGDVRSEHIRQGGGGGHGRDEYEEYRKQVEIERQIQDAIRDEQKKKYRAAQYQHESLPCTTDYQDLRKGGPGSEKLSSAQPKLCYRALLQHGRVAECLVRDPPTFKVPQEMLQDAPRLNLDKAQTLEIWDLGGKLIRTERIFDEFHRVLRYRATIEYGKLAYPDHVYPPGSQPPQYMLDDMISRHSQVPKAVLTIWENGQGGLSPAVETGFRSWLSEIFAKTLVKQA
ncbi:predicted protein [Nematostella vectensis]|uniref:Uncharacterized protein n=1 Tax=Nematostella vectensis TaxID=45351 RepID=A7SVQ6_NEMVE|nr:predicted protein [Nematostella vectensis]|eukprot:XP_001624317.1 predicted protein [Nematostella vectensis]